MTPSSPTPMTPALADRLDLVSPDADAPLEGTRTPGWLSRFDRNNPHNPWLMAADDDDDFEDDDDFDDDDEDDFDDDEDDDFFDDDDDEDDDDFDDDEDDD